MDPESPSAKLDPLRSAEAGGRVVRGGAQRVASYVAGTALVAGASILLLRHLGVVDFGRYVTVMSLIAIVSGVTDAGLTAVGARELALRGDDGSRNRLVANLIGLRLVLTPIGVALAAGFALVAGYDSVLVEGTLLAGFGLVLVNVQAAATIPLAVALENGRLAVNELVKQTVTVLAIGILALAGASLLPFFVAQIAVGLVILALTPVIAGRQLLVRPRLDRAEARFLLREAIPIAVALAVAQVYFRILVIMLSLMATAEQTGLFGTSYRIVEMLFAIPTVLFAVVLPVTAVAGEEDPRRLHYVLQRMTEVGLIASLWVAVTVAIVAEPIIELLGGEEYRGAADALRIQIFALVGFFLNQAWATVLISIREQRRIAIANGIALSALVAMGLVLIPAFGIEGAAAAAVVADALLALLLFVALARSRPGIAPSLAFAPKVFLAAGLAAAAVLIPGSVELAEAAVATVVFWAAVALMRLVPPEVLDQLPWRRAPAG